MTDIKVGDTVRIKKMEDFMYGQGNEAGVEFVVTGVAGRPGLAPEHGNYYVTGDPAGRGVWVAYVEKVASEETVPDARWRYNDHIVVYPGSLDRTNGYNDRLGDGVTILDETPLPKIYTRWKNQDDNLERLDDEITKAARAYWDAHETNPVLKEAKVRGDYVRFAYQLRYTPVNQWVAGYTKADIDAALPVIDRLALKESE